MVVVCLQTKDQFTEAAALRDDVDQWTLNGALESYSKYRQAHLPGKLNVSTVLPDQLNSHFEYDFLLNCKYILATVNGRLEANIDSLGVYLEKLTRYKVFVVEQDALIPPVDELELIGLGISPIKQRPHNVPQKHIDLRRSAIKSDRKNIGSRKKKPDTVPKQLFATHKDENGGYRNRNTNRHRPAPHLRHSKK